MRAPSQADNTSTRQSGASHHAVPPVGLGVNSIRTARAHHSFKETTCRQSEQGSIVPLVPCLAGAPHLFGRSFLQTQWKKADHLDHSLKDWVNSLPRN